MRLVTMEEYVQLPRPQLSWLVHKVIPRPGLVLFQGPPKMGKTRMAMGLARAVEKGEEWLGQPTQQGKVVYVQLDVSDQVWTEVARDLMEGGVDLPFHVVAPEDAKRPVNILTPEGRLWFTKVAAQDPAMVIIDVLREVHTLDENDSGQMKLVGDALIEVFGQTALVVLHHAKKPTPNPKTGEVREPNPIHAGRGSSYIPGKADSVWYLGQGRLHMVPRFDEEVVYKAQMDDLGWWSFPDMEVKQDMVGKLLRLCSEHPTMNHAQIAKLSHTRYGISRAQFYRYVKGRRCAHSRPVSPGTVSQPPSL